MTALDSDRPTHGDSSPAHNEGARIVTFSMHDNSAEELVDPLAHGAETSSGFQSDEPKIHLDKLHHVPSVKAIREALVGCNAPTDLVHYVVGAVHSYETLLRRLSNVIEARERYVRGEAVMESAHSDLDDADSIAHTIARRTTQEPGAPQQPLQTHPDQVLYSPSPGFSAIFKHPYASAEEQDLATPKPHLPGVRLANAAPASVAPVFGAAEREDTMPHSRLQKRGHTMSLRTSPVSVRLRNEASPPGIPRPSLSNRARGATPPHSTPNAPGSPGAPGCSAQSEQPAVLTASRSHQTEGHWATRFGRAFIPSTSTGTNPLPPSFDQWGDHNHVPRVTPEPRSVFVSVHQGHGLAPVLEERNYTAGSVRTLGVEGNRVAQPPTSNTFQEQRQPLETYPMHDTAVFSAEPHGYMIHACPVTPFVQMPEYQDLPLPTVQPLGLPDRRRCRWGLQGRSNMALSGTARVTGAGTTAPSGSALFGRAPSPPEYCNFLPQLFCCCNSG